MKRANDFSQRGSLLFLGKGKKARRSERDQIHHFGVVGDEWTKQAMSGSASMTIPTLYPATLLLNIVWSCRRNWDDHYGHGNQCIIGTAFVGTTALRIFNLFLQGSTKAGYGVLIVIKTLLSGEIAAKRMSQAVLL